MRLRYLYVGSSDTERDLAAWLRIPGASLRWRFQHFGADVAAVDLGSAPAVLIADHRPTGSILPIYSVDDLVSSVAAFEAGGWQVEERSLGTPEGVAAVLSDPSGTHIALLQVERPEAMESSYANEANTHASAVLPFALCPASSQAIRSSPRPLQPRSGPCGRRACR